MEDPFGVRSEGDVRVACQIIHVGGRDEAMLIDLVTIEPCHRGGHELAAGTPLTLGFKAGHLDEGRQELEGVVAGWEAGGDILVLEAADVSRGICYRFSDGQEHLTLVLNELPPDRDPF